VGGEEKGNNYYWGEVNKFELWTVFFVLKDRVRPFWNKDGCCVLILGTLAEVSFGQSALAPGQQDSSLDAD
jgi:hypothetical protein